VYVCEHAATNTAGYGIWDDVQGVYMYVCVCMCVCVYLCVCVYASTST